MVRPAPSPLLSSPRSHAPRPGRGDHSGPDAARPRRARCAMSSWSWMTRGDLWGDSLRRMALLRTEDRDSVRHLVLDRPDKRNALNGELIRELGAAIEGAAADDSVRVVVVRGEGAMFSSGMDLKD